MKVLRAMALALCLIGAGCGAGALSVRPKIKTSPLLSLETDGIVERLWLRDNEVTSLRALSRSTFEQEDDSQTVRQVFVFEKPDKLRFETLPLNASIALSLVISRDGLATFLDSIQKKATRGSAEKEFFNALLHIPASERELMSFLTGRIPTRFLNPGELQMYRNGDGTLSVVKDDFLYYWVVNETDYSVRECQIRDQFKGILLFKVTYEGTQVVSDIVLPKKISLEVPKEDFKSTIDFTQVKLNEDVPDNLFKVEIPSDYKIK